VLEPRGVRSDLLEQFRRSQPPPSPVTVPLYPFEDTTLFDSHRGLIRFFRRLFRPLLKLFFNANALASSMHAQTVINRQTIDRLDAMEASLRGNGDLYYELLHNMVVELTRMTIEVKNAKMRVESIASRLEFNERRARALESAVVYKPADVDREASAPYQPQRQQPSSQPTAQSSSPPVTPPPQRSSYLPAQQTGSAPQPQPSAESPAAGEGPGQRSRRRRRRRGRRGGASAVSIMGPQGQGQSDGSPAPSEANPADGRETRPEPIEHAFGSAAHPAETSRDESSAPSPAAPASELSDDDQ
jgi:hypothetical protein